MATTVELADQELVDLKEITSQSDAAEAVRVAMHAFMRYSWRMQFK